MIHSFEINKEEDKITVAVVPYPCHCIYTTIAVGGFDSFCSFEDFCSFQFVVGIVGCSTAATVAGQNYKLEFVTKSAGAVDAGRGSVFVVDFVGITAATMLHLYLEPVVVVVVAAGVVAGGGGGVVVVVVVVDSVVAAGEILFYPMA